MAIRLVDIGVFEMTGGRQDQVGIGHAVGHADIAADHEKIFVGQRLLHQSLARMNGDRIVVVDKQGLDRRRQAAIKNAVRNIEDAEFAAASRIQIVALESIPARGEIAADITDSCPAGADVASQYR